MTTTTQRGWSRLGRTEVAIASLVLPLTVWWATRPLPAWAAMWAIAASEFFALKLLTLTAVAGRPVAFSRVLAYLALWPGMEPQTFLFDRAEGGGNPRPGELGFA